MKNLKRTLIIFLTLITFISSIIFVSATETSETSNITSNTTSDTSQDTSSKNTSSEENKPSNHTSSEDTSSQDNTSSEDTSSEDTSSEDTSSENTSSDNSSSEDTSSQDTSSDDTSSDNSSSKPEVQLDYSRLQAVINSVYKLDKNDYTTESWRFVQSALTEAENGLNSKDQSEINHLFDLLKMARDELEKKPITYDYSKLQTAIDGANILDKSDYTSATWSALQSALDNASAGLDLKDQDKIDSLTSKLNNAIANLSFKLDYSALQSAIDNANDLDEDDYKSSSWSALQSALKKAKDGLSSTEQAKVNDLVSALNNAIDNLEKAETVAASVDYSSLNSTINRADNLDKYDYTSSSWARLENALEQARNTLSSKSQSAVNSAKSALTTAISNLVEKQTSEDTSSEDTSSDNSSSEDTSSDENSLSEEEKALQEELDYYGMDVRDDLKDLELKDLIEKAELIVEEDYTADSWKVFANSLKSANENIESTSTFTIENSRVSLLKAMSSLVSLADKSKLQAAIDETTKIDGKYKFPEMWEELASIVEEGKVLLYSNDQVAIDKTTAEILTLTDKLNSEIANSADEDDSNDNKGGQKNYFIVIVVVVLVLIICIVVVIFIIFFIRKDNDDDDFDIDEVDEVVDGIIEANATLDDGSAYYKYELIKKGKDSKSDDK